MSRAADLLLRLGDTQPIVPTAGQISFYAKTDGVFYSLDSDGVETPLAGGTVTSVGIIANPSRFVVTDSPITSSGNIEIDLAESGVVAGSYTNANITVDAYGRITSASNGSSSGGVSSFNTRTGAITLTDTDVTTALGYTPYDASNPDGFISEITSSDVTTALGYTPYDASNPDGFISEITSSDVTTALGFTPGQGTVTSIAVSGGTTGLTTTGGPITDSGTITLSGTLAISNGGTGATTATGAITALLPDQTGNTGKVLGTDGSNVAWVSAAVSGVSSFNTRTGDVTLTSGDVTDALTYTPAEAGSNGDITAITGMTGGIETPTYIDFDTGVTPTSAVGRLSWNVTDGTLQVGLAGGNVSLQIGQEQVVRVLNNSGTDMTNGSVVYINGAAGNRPTVRLARADSETTSAGTIGILTEDILNNQEGFVTTNGLIHNINTGGFSDGDTIYLSPSVAGGYTNVKPTAPDHLVVLGYVIRAHTSVGQVFVKVDNGYELDELHNVLIDNPTNGQVLTYDSATGVWENVTPTDGTVTSVTVSGSDGIVVTDGTVTSSGTISLSLGDITPNSVSATGSISGSNLSGTNTGDQTIELTGDVTGSGTGSFVTTLSNTTVTAGTYNLATITVDSKGRITAASSGTAGAGTVTSVDVSGGTTGLTFSGGPITDSGTITMAGTLAIANGGTGQTTRQAAINALTGVTTVGYFLRGDGTNVTMSAIQVADVPTLNQNTTGSAAKLTTARSISATGDATWTVSFDGSADVSGSLTLANTAVTAGTYGSGTQVPVFTVDSKGRITGVTNTTITTGGSTYTAGGGIDITSDVISLNISADSALTKTNNTDELALILASGSGLEQSTLGLKISDAGVTNTMLENSSFTVGSSSGSAVVDLGGSFAIVGQNGITTAVVPDSTTLNVSATTATTSSIGVAKFNAADFDVTAGDVTIKAGSIDLTTDITGTLPIANGGTGATTAPGAINALLPDQTGNAGFILTTDGTDVSWQEVTGTGTVTSVTVEGTSGRITSSGSPITTSGTITLDLATTAVTAGTYGSASNVPVVTVDAYGRVTNVSQSAISTAPEIVVFRYTAGTSGTLNISDAIYSQTSGVTATVTDGATSTVQFSFTGKSNPPKSIIFYGQITSSNNFVIRSPVGTSTTIVVGGGSSSAPDIINGVFTSSNIITIVCNPTATGAVGAAGVRAYAMVEFGF